MTTERIPIEPTVLVWARESIGLTQDAAAKKLNVSSRTIAKWESGDLYPTIVQLRKAASQYKRPLVVLLLPEPPEDFDALRDFRSLPTTEASEWSPELHAEYRRVLEQREVVLELAELTEGVIPEVRELPHLSLGMAAEDAASTLRSHFGVTTHEFGDPYEALSTWTGAIENSGLLIVHTRGIDIAEMRGFSISEWPYPVIALNGSDYPRGRLFTVLHEVVHLALNAGGLCDLHEEGGRKVAAEIDRLEHYCNQVAAGIVMPEAAVLGEPEVSSATADNAWTLPELHRVAQRYSVSSEAMLLRLVTLGKATWKTYRQRKPELDAEYAASKERERQRRREKAGGPTYYRVKVRDLGKGYVRSVLDAFHSRQISSLDVTDFLDVKFGQLERLEREVGR